LDINSEKRTDTTKSIEVDINVSEDYNASIFRKKYLSPLHGAFLDCGCRRYCLDLKGDFVHTLCLSIHPRIPARIFLDGFSLNLVSENFTEICRYIAVWVRIVQICGTSHEYLNVFMCVRLKAASYVRKSFFACKTLSYPQSCELVKITDVSVIISAPIIRI
jgi:hypothetical protein